MVEITSSAYQDLRNYIQANWQYVELQDEAGNAIKRLSLNDSRVTSVIEGNKVKITVVVNGTDSTLIGKTFAKSLIFNVATGGESFSEETFTPFTIESEQDELTVIHTISVPMV